MLSVSEQAGTSKLIDNSGITSWVFENGSDSSSHLSGGRAVACLSVHNRRGRGIYAQRPLRTSSCVFSETPIIAVASGKHRDRVCSNCSRIGLTRAVRHESCPALTFCDRACMESLSNFIDLCGELFGKFDSGSEHIDTFRLLVLFLYNRSGSKAFIASKLNESINEAELHLEQKPAPELKRIYKLWFDLIKEFGDASLLAQDEGPEIIDRFHRAVKFNAQSLPIPNLPSTYLVCLFACVSKLNHSCRPNAQVLFSNSDGVLRAHVVTTRDIARGEEICISYLNALGLPVDLRRQLLLQAFHFCCECDRCLKEASHLRAMYVFPCSSDAQSLHSIISSSLDNDTLVEKNVGAFLSFLKHGDLEELRVDGETHDRSIDAIRVFDFASKAFLILKGQFQRHSGCSNNENPSIATLKCKLIQTSYVLSSVLFAVGSEYSNDRLMIIMYGVGIASKIRSAEIKDSDIIKSINKIISEANRVLNFHLSIVNASDSRARALGTAAYAYEQLRKSVESVRVALGVP